MDFSHAIQEPHSSSGNMPKPVSSLVTPVWSSSAHWQDIPVPHFSPSSCRHPITSHVYGSRTVTCLSPQRFPNERLMEPQISHCINQMDQSNSSGKEFRSVELPRLWNIKKLCPDCIPGIPVVWKRIVQFPLLRAQACCVWLSHPTLSHLVPVLYFKYISRWV